LTLPLVGVSVLVGHTLAYHATGAPPGTTHAYLDHAPQVLALLVLAALLGLALDTRTSGVGTLRLAGLGPVVFVAQEHLEPVVHGADVPLLLDDRTFVLGLALQAPVGVLSAWIARRLVVVLRRSPAPAARHDVWHLPLVVAPHPAASHRAAPITATRGRGPPLALRS
jgi:hypothetical protein